MHGAVNARNVLVRDGRAYLSDFGLADEGATAEDDRAALAELVRAAARRASARRRGIVLAAAGDRHWPGWSWRWSSSDGDSGAETAQRRRARLERDRSAAI